MKRPITKEDLYAGSAGCLSYALGLPLHDGELSRFAVVKYKAEKGDTPLQIWTNVLAGFGGKLPRRNIGEIAEVPVRLRQEFGRLARKNLLPILVIEDAHSLRPESLYSLKHLFELPTAFDPRPGVLLLGRRHIIEKLLKQTTGMIAHTKYIDCGGLTTVPANK